jgi:diguanylate cyclase (GGDEF)-like protein/PAS domain S-box-containing protein
MESRPIRVLLVEDSEEDALLLLRELRNGGYAPESARVDSPEALLESLQQGDWDIVFTDYTMPRFSGIDALKLLRDRGYEMPVIFVSGTIGEDRAVEAMRMGANDYIMKNNLKRLIPAVEREREVARSRLERRYEGERRREAEARYGHVLATTPDAIISTDSRQRITVFNHGAEHIFGYLAEEVLGQPLDLLLPEHLRQVHLAHVQAFAESPDMAKGISERKEISGRRKDGSLFPARASISKLMEEDGMTFTVILHDVTQQKQNEERIRYLAHYDVLTGLPNRVLFGDRLEQAIAEAERRGRIVGLIMLDLDRFKTINDTLGHGAGDALLQHVARRLVGCVRQDDTVARLGGDEFAVVLVDVAHPGDAARVARTILDGFIPPFSILGRELFMGASLGISLYPLDGRETDILMKNADVAMYRVKGSGRSSYQFYEPEMTAQAEQRLALENDLRHAMERGELLVLFQPQEAVATGRLEAFEALVRWQHPERGLVTPDTFIPLAEENGLIVQIGEWVLEYACACSKGWQEAGLPPIKVAVNVSSRQFLQNDLFTIVERVLQKTGLDPHLLELEITESMLMQDEQSALETIRQINMLGVNFSLDDFGTGYSSLSRLKRFPLSTLKIDQSFIADIPHDQFDAAIVRSIVSMGHGLGIRVLAEGVENQDQMDFLRDSGCDMIQGFHYGRPLTAEDAGKVLSAEVRAV